jgi:predicted dehydrogenase
MLIEKPISLAINEGIEMINIAHSNHVTLAVGHVERFNPAIIELKSRITNNELGRVFQIDARRQGPFPPRIRDVGVVIDLAVHDLDIIRYISGSEPVRVFAEIAHRVRDEQEDMLCSTLRLNNGVIATLTINWLTPTKIRELQVIGERGMFRVDYITQDLYFFENATAAGSEWETLRNLRGVSEGAMTRFAIAKKEPLRAELEAFISTIKGEANNIVSGEDGLCALRLGLASLQSSQEECVIVLQN